MTKEYVVNSEHEGNKIRYINYSDNPNVWARPCAVKGEARIGIYTSCDIPAQSELFIDYGEDYDYKGNGIRSTKHPK
jgi:SET domain-containing protein